MSLLLTAIGAVGSMLLYEIINEVQASREAKSEAERQAHNHQIQLYLDQNRGEVDKIINEISNLDTDYGRLVSQLAYAAPGGSAAKYRNAKEKEYVMRRNAAQQRQDQINKQTAALNQLLK